LEVFPDADVFSLVDFLPNSNKSFLKGKTPKTTFIQNLPFAKKHFRNYFPWFPIAVETHDLRPYDLILSSSHMVSKGVIINQDQLHVCYCHSPCRYAWDLYHQYLDEAGLKTGVKGFIAQFFLHRLRVWDQISTPRVHHFIANSKYIAKRISHVYNRVSEVVYPPVDVQNFTYVEEKDDYYFAAARLVPYKKMDLIVEAFGLMPDKKLIIVGSGPDDSKLKKYNFPNVELRKEADASEFLKLISRAKAFVFAAEEDFGITLAEAQACGTPVIAFGKGGASDIVIDGITGVLFWNQTSDSLISAVNKFESIQSQLVLKNISLNSQRFSNFTFREQLTQTIFRKWKEFKNLD
jgi:glycosyltransferase involved in cell wall biosynthesis